MPTLAIVSGVEHHAEVPSEEEARTLDDLVADCAEVSRHLAEVSRPDGAIRIPERAVAVVADLSVYGD